MKPVIVHRYTWPIREAIEELLGEAAGDCAAWKIRVEGDELVIDVVAPAEAAAAIVDLREERLKRAGIDQHFIEDGSPHERMVEDAAAEAGQSASKDAAKINTPPERKGGPIARRAGIVCNEKGFWTFAGVKSATEAGEHIREKCGIDSRADLDHDDAAASIFEDIDKRYRLWLEGYDL